MDNATQNEDRLMYARELVDMNINKGFLEEVHFTNEYNELVWQAIKYDWKPSWCNKCQNLGHVEVDRQVGKSN